MGGMSMWHWMIVGGVLLLLFGGKGKISDIMGDFAKGIKSFKKGMNDDEVAEVPRPSVDPLRPAEPARTIDHRTTTIETKTVDPHRVG